MWQINNRFRSLFPVLVDGKRNLMKHKRNAMSDLNLKGNVSKHRCIKLSDKGAHLVLSNHARVYSGYH